MAATRQARALISITVVLVLLLAIGVVVVRLVADRVVFHESCTATAGTIQAAVSVEQAENASTIAAVAAKRGLPARAATIALATALQESDLRNLDHGDRDSLGLFQQRPSQGWGTAEQVRDPVYAATAFYDALVRIEGYRTMNINDAAQLVQRSGFPEAYNKHEPRARALASTLMGHSPAGFTCRLRTASAPAQSPGSGGLTRRAAAVLAEVEAAFGEQESGGFDPDGVSSGHAPGSAHYSGRAVDLFYRPVQPQTRRDGWASAHWLVANADRMQIATVIYDGKIWTVRRSKQGWRNYAPPNDNTDNSTLMHRDHVHVDVR